jgi:hypothetical protein
MVRRVPQAYLRIIVGCIIGVWLATAVFGANVSTSASVSNVPPVASSAELNGAADITLTAGSATEIVGLVEVTDYNGCDEIIGVNSTLYRTNISGADSAPDDKRSHYSIDCYSLGFCNYAGDLTDVYACAFQVEHYADPTDVGSVFENTDWTFNATPFDAEIGSSDYDRRELTTLSALSVQTPAIDFGTLSLGSNTSSTNQETLIRNMGNEGLDIDLRGYGLSDGDGNSLACTLGEVQVGYVQYETGPFTYGSGIELSDVDELVDIDLERGSESASLPNSTVFFGLGFPSGGISGSCSGTLVITGVSDPDLD